MEKGWTYLEKDFSDEDLIDQPFDTGIDEFIYTMLSEHFKNSTYMVDMQYLRKYKTISIIHINLPKTVMELFK